MTEPERPEDEGDDEPIVAPREDSTTGTSGITIVESVESLVASIESGSWVDGTVAGLAAALDVVATILDPLGSLTAAGLGWLIEHVQPLSDLLDQLTGDPDAVAAQSRTWRNIGRATRGAADDLDTAAAPGPGWGGPAADGFARNAAGHADRLRQVARAADGLAAAVEGAGMLVAAVRETVRDLVAQLVATLLVRVPQWGLEEVGTFGVATPHVVVSALAVIGRTGARVLHFVQGLLRSIRRLGDLLTDLGRLLPRLGDDLARHAPDTSPPRAPDPTTPAASSPDPTTPRAPAPDPAGPSAEPVSPGHASPGTTPSSTPIRDALEPPRSPDGRVPIHRNRHGVLTDGRYRVGDVAQARHGADTSTAGRSRFLPSVDPERLALELARRADDEGLWVASNADSPSGAFRSKAKIVLEQPIGIHGETGLPTTVVNLYRKKNGTIHIAPGSPQ